MSAGPDRRRVLATLCATQVVAWGVLFYAFPVLQGSISADTGWQPTTVAGAFTLGQVAAAFGGLVVGRVLDRHGPRLVMTAGSVLAVLACAAVATATTRAGFVLAWLLAGAAMAAVLYAPAFAAITGWYAGTSRLRALTVLTVAGGLASTVFAPLTAAVHEGLGWRQTYAVLAGVLLLTAPAHWWGLRGPWGSDGSTAGPVCGQPAYARDVLRSREFVALATALAIAGLCASAVVVNLVPLLLEQGLGLGTASLLLGLGGLGQVLGRIGYLPIALRTSPVAQAVLVLAVLALTTALFGLVDAVLAVAVVVLLAGAARGSLTLLRATAVPDRWGTGRYAQLSAALALPVALAAAAAPWVGAQLAAWLGSHAAAFLALAALNAVAVGLALLSGTTLGEPGPAGAPPAGGSAAMGRVTTRARGRDREVG